MKTTVVFPSEMMFKSFGHSAESVDLQRWLQNLSQYLNSKMNLRPFMEDNFLFQIFTNSNSSPKRHGLFLYKQPEVKILRHYLFQ
jgi:hypothetical protein